MSPEYGDWFKTKADLYFIGNVEVDDDTETEKLSSEQPGEDSDWEVECAYVAGEFCEFHSIGGYHGNEYVMVFDGSRTDGGSQVAHGGITIGCPASKFAEWFEEVPDNEMNLNEELPKVLVTHGSRR
jgi:hypothetical protein